MQVVFLVLLFVIGSCLGSFLCCQARRLHLKEQGSKKHAKSAKLNPRSICLHCKSRLKWYDNIPIFSWLLLGGRCRKCGQKIGSAEILSELGTASAFLALGIKFLCAHPAAVTLTSGPSNSYLATPSSLATPLDWFIFFSVLIFVSNLIFLAVYDGLYGQLPTKCLISAVIFATVTLSLTQVNAAIAVGFTPELIWQPILSALLLGGTYLILYLISKGKWVGDGDWLLGLAIGLALGHAWLALITLFLANLFACIYALPRLKKSHQIHLGPFLTISFVIVLAFSDMFLTFIF